MKPDFDLGSIGQISRSVSDIDRAEAWYRDVLELTHLYRFGASWLSSIAVEPGSFSRKGRRLYPRSR